MHDYPPNPSRVPAGLTDAPPSYRRKAWIAGLALAAFFLAYAALTGWFAYKAYALLGDWLRTGASTWSGLAAGAVAAFLALFLGKAMFFVRRHHARASVEITADEQPRLFAFIHRLATDTGAPIPHRVFLSPRVNAAVFYDLRVVNLLFPSRKNLEIGVGLVNTLTLSELKAVLAHELGHFVQRSMAVGNWVYIGQQIAAAIVSKRDIFDRFLQGLSSIDIRIAWIGWAMRIVVWSIRSVVDSFFSVIAAAELALSREMELQADLVSVSVSGSDALVHALSKLRAADTAWDHALDVFADEVKAGRPVPDLFAMHLRVVENMRWMLANPHWGGIAVDPSSLSAEARAQHRVFTPDLAQPPQMWSTHPPSHVREDNAKRRYVDAMLDARPAWVAFDDPDAVRERITTRVAELVREDHPPAADAGEPPSESRAELATALAAVDARFAKLRLDPRYRGAYRERHITRSVAEAASLCTLASPAVDDEARLACVRSELADLYPASSAELLERADRLQSERDQLDAIRLGVATAPGGVVRHRSAEVRKRDLDRVIADVERERDEVLAELHARDRQIRSAHRDAALLLGRGWPEYLEGLRALLHYAEHTEAHVDEAGAHLHNVW